MNDNWTQKFNYNLPSSSQEREKKIIQKLINYFIDLTTRIFFGFVSDNFLKAIFNSINLDFRHYKCEGIKRGGNDDNDYGEGEACGCLIIWKICFQYYDIVRQAKVASVTDLWFYQIFRLDEILMVFLIVN